MLKKQYDKIKNEQATLIIIKNNEVVCSDSGIGVKPIMKVINENPDIIKNAIVIDKVIGKAAAMLLIKFGAIEVHGLLMSKTAIRMFEMHDIKYCYENLVDTIHNKTASGLCPLEDSVKNTDDLQTAFENIKKRIYELMNGLYKV